MRARILGRSPVLIRRLGVGGCLFLALACGQEAVDPADADPHADHRVPSPMDEAVPASAGAGEVHLDSARTVALGIRVIPAVRGDLARTLRLSASVDWDESRLSTVSLRFGGYVERLHVSVTGAEVRPGEPLLEIYSPELVAGLEELLSAVRLGRRFEESTLPGAGVSAERLRDAVERRLDAWEIPAELVQEVLTSGEVPRTHVVIARTGGIVTERLVQVGERVAVGQPLYRMAELDPVWIEARLPESDFAVLREGMSVAVELRAHPGRTLPAFVSRIYPDLDASTRTGRIRIALPNPERLALPGMLATVEIEAPLVMDALLIPGESVIRGGRRDVIFVEEAPGHFVGREIEIGAEAVGMVEVLSGLEEGERFVARGAFLLDAESRLMTEGSMPGMDHSVTQP
jgi:multidrug efflux pump subunit AcrA (membrane-fusion protein)